VAEEYREAFGEHAYDEEGNYIGALYNYSTMEFTPETEAQAAWADFVNEDPHLHPENDASTDESASLSSDDVE